jgi:hypothetical protein
MAPRSTISKLSGPSATESNASATSQQQA